MTLAPIERLELPDPPRNGWVDKMRPAAELAKMIAETEFVPAELRNRTEAVAACILYGDELGIGPMVSLAKIDIIKGRPAPKAELGRMLAFGAGHDLWLDEATNTRVVWCGKRHNSTHVFRVAWTMDDVRKAGIAGNPAYAKYPRQMLIARASAELVRQMCPEVLGGITLFAEEAVDIDETVMPAIGPTLPVNAGIASTTPPATRKRSRRQVAASPPAGEPAAEGAAAADSAPAAAPPSEKRTEAQTKMAMAGFADIGITDRDERHHATSAILGNRPTLTSWNDLTRDDASTVIDALEKLKAGQLHFVIDDTGQWSVQPTGDDLLSDE